MGWTYSSDFLPLEKPAEGGTGLETNIPDYIIFYSSLPCTDLRLVVEFIVRVSIGKAVHQSGYVAPGSHFQETFFSAGWAMLEISQERKNLFCDILEGSPRFLLLPKITEISKKGTKVEFQTMAAGGLNVLKKLVPENCLIGPHEILPGLAAEQLPTYAGNLLQSDENSEILKLLPSMNLYVNNCVIKVPPNIDNFIEKSFCEALDVDLLLTNVTVYEYRLRVAAHNQWTCVNKAQLKNSIILTKEGDFLKANGVPIIDNVFISPGVGLVFQLECALKISKPEIEIIPILLGELVVLPNYDINQSQFVPLSVQTKFSSDAKFSTGVAVWRSQGSYIKGDCEILLLCEISPYQGSAEVSTTIGLMKAIDEKRKIEDEHKKWLKEMQQREIQRNRELELKERELGIKSRQISAYSAYAKNLKLNESPGGIPSSPHTPIKGVLQMGAQVQDTEAKNIKIIEENQVPLSPTQEGIMQAVGREIPRGDQVILEDIANTKIINSPRTSDTRPLLLLKEDIQFALKGSTITIEFTQIKAKENLPTNLTFSFQFYTYPTARTEAVSIEKGIGELSGLKLIGAVKNWTNITTSTPETCSLKLIFEIDPNGDDIDKSFNEFINYLRETTFKLWVWDAETQMPIGVCKIGLSDLIRINEPMKVIKNDYDIISNDEESISLGSLSLLLQNIGRKENVSSNNLPNAISTMKSTIVKKRGKVKVRSKPLTTKDLSKTPQVDEKSALVYAYKEYTLHAHGHKAWEKEGLLSDYEKYRTFSRTVALAGMVDAPVPEKGVEFSVGEMKIYPVQFVNQYSRDTQFTINIHDPENRNDIKLVSEPHEWKFYSSKLGFEEPPDWNMISLNPLSNNTNIGNSAESNIKNPKFTLKSYERVVLLFKVIALSPPLSYNRAVNITIFNTVSNSAEQNIELFLQYKPKPYNSTFMLNLPESRSVDISLLPEPCSEAFRRSKFFLCNDPNTEISILGNKLNLTINTGLSPIDSELYIASYEDEHYLEHLCTFYLLVRSYTCIDINETAGKRVTQYISIDSSPSQSDIKLYSSNPNFVRLATGFPNPLIYSPKPQIVPIFISSYKLGRSIILFNAIGIFQYFHIFRYENK